MHAVGADPSRPHHSLCIASQSCITFTIMAHRITVDLRPSSPAGSVRSNRSCSSTSTLDSVSVAYETAPPLCPLLSVREHSLSKRPQTDSLPGWGLVLRGTTSELSEGSKIYCCQIDSIHHGGAAKVI